MIQFLLFLIFGYEYGVAQKTPCDTGVQNIGVNESYYIQKSYNANQTYRYVGNCPDGHNCKMQCNLNIPSSPNCKADRFMISRAGDPFLTGADAYCGQRKLTVASSGRSISFGLITPASSVGGSFSCKLSARPMATELPVGGCRCGDRKQKRIVGGEETGLDEYTMMAGLIHNATDAVQCGGVIISSNYILTAAHCVDPYSRNPGALFVTVGDHYLRKKVTQRYEIGRFIIHKNYYKEMFDYDIALVELSRKIKFTDTVQPVCLPFKYENTDFSNKNVTILGWGSTSPGGPISKVLRKVEVNIMSQENCRSTEGNITARQICTFTSGKDACQGDSGGPVLLTDPASKALFLVGLVSYSNAWCGTTRPGIHTRVTALLPWVIDNARASFCFKK